MLNVRVKKALLTILTACLTVLMTIGAVLGFTPTTQTVKADEQQFEKVTTAPADWSGTYLIVYDSGASSVAFDGSLSNLDQAKKAVSVTITDGVIAYTEDLAGKTFTIEKSGNSYTIKSASGYYIGSTTKEKNELKTSTTTTYTNSISLESDGTVKIVGSGTSVLRYNAGANDLRFRYYKASTYTGQKAICLYKLVDVTSGGETPTECQHPNAYEKYVSANGQHTWQLVCDDCNNVVDSREPTDCNITWGEYSTANGKHTRIGACDTCGAEKTEDGNCTVSNATYKRVSDTKHNAIGTCDTCGNPTEISEDCVYTKTAEDDNGVTYECESCDNTDTNLKYTITFHVPGGITPVTALRVEEGKTEALPTEEDVGTYDGYTFAGWTTEAGYNDTTSPAIYASYTMGEENVDLYALYTYTEESTEATGYVKVTSASQLAVGDTVVIVASDYDYALSTNQKSNNRGQADVTKNGDTVTFGDDVQLITLEEGTVAGTFAFNVGDGYLYAAGASSNNYLRTGDLDENGSWKIEISNSVATIKAQNEKTRNQLLYNKTSSLFSCYSGPSNDAKVVCLYRLASGTTHYLTDIGPKIVSASLTLGKELVVNYKVEMDASLEDAEMTFTMNGVETTVAGTKDGNVYVYSFAIAPQYMGANIAAELKLNGTFLTSKATYSVVEYANYWLDNTTGEKMTNLLNALLQYGAAAQMYKDVDTDNLVANLENLGEVPEDPNASLVSEVAKEDRGVSFKSAGLYFSSVNTLYVTLTNYDENVELVVTVDGTEYTVTRVGNTFYTEGLKATEFGKTFTFVLSYDGVVMQTLTYSVNAYAYNFGQEGKEGAMANLARALYNYGVAAENYVG